jgi:hypothetical protein
MHTIAKMVVLTILVKVETTDIFGNTLIISKEIFDADPTLVGINSLEAKKRRSLKNSLPCQI